ncbi:MAG: hypothetical protein BWZ06_01963 [Bacteroidetes bacterium ADurb.BinA261]|nr:MAG: hypothetical protein BWZ06_01963 [Bacteroidetes bacterium ADurb.BinA261]
MIVAHKDIGFFVFIFIHECSNEGLEYIVKRDNSVKTSIFINHNGKRLMLISEGFENFLRTQRRRKYQWFLNQLVERNIMVFVIFYQKLLYRNNTHKIVEFAIAGKHFTMLAFQQIFDNPFFLLKHVHPLHIRAMRHQMTGSFVGKIENLFVNDIFFPFDHTFFGGCFEHGS